MRHKLTTYVVIAAVTAATVAILVFGLVRSL